MWALRAAGVEVEELFDFWYDVEIHERKKLPAELTGYYFRDDPSVPLRVKVLVFEPHTHLEVDVAGAAVGRKIKATLDHYSVENDGKAVADREHKQLWREINKVLERDKLSYDKLQRGEGILTRRAIESLMKLCDTVDPIRQGSISDLFTGHWVAKPDRAFTAAWLIKQFERERDPFEQIGMRLWDIAVPAVADDLIRLLKDRHYGDRRGPIALALARTKDPRSADVIASVLDDEHMTRWALQALGKLASKGAAKHVEQIRKHLRHPDSDVRREAKKTLKKLGVEADAPPPPEPVHLVSNRKAIPRGLEEWSQNLDMDDVVPTLQRLSKCIDAGFAETEIAEVTAVIEEMKHDQTKAFRFPVTARGKKSDVFIEIFMDDIDSPDLAIYAGANVIRQFEKLAPEP